VNGTRYGSNRSNQKDSLYTKKEFLRQRRSSRTRSIHSDDPYDRETLSEQKITLRSGIGDQPGNYESFDDETEKSRSVVEGHESESKSVASKTKNSVEHFKTIDSAVKIHKPDEKHPPSRFQKLKIRKQPSSLYEDVIVSSKTDEQDDSTEIAVIQADKPKVTRKAKYGVKWAKTASRNQRKTKVDGKTSLFASYFPSMGKARTTIPKSVHMAVGFKFVKNDCVRKHTCGQELRKLLGIPQKKMKPKLAIAAKNSKNAEGASFSDKNDTDISGIKKSNTAGGPNVDYKLKSPMGTCIPERHYPSVLSYSPSYAPKTYLPQVSSAGSYLPPPRAHFTRQFQSYIPKS